MSFNSGTFLQFLAAFILLYYSVRNHLQARNILVVAASYLFYGWWDYRFLGLLLFSSLLDYYLALALDRPTQARARRLLVWTSVGANLGILGVFKYYDFFAESLGQLLRGLGLEVEPATLRVILPVGISFYTFQTMSYTIDVYRGQIPASRDVVAFLAFVSFFPQLVAGPIERARHLLPQFKETHRITGAMLEEGLWLCLWGLFKKVVLADNLAPLVEMVYDHARPGGLMVGLATVAFGLQIYCDFSGYSDIARGTARLLGFDIMVNFNLPYVAANPREFWSRWHISLSTWLRDYLYISLGGNRRGQARTYRNLMATLLLGGLWHGAAWNFVAWGGWHGAGLLVHRWWLDRRGVSAGGTNAAAASRQAPPPRWPMRLACWVGTMLFVFYGWLLFRAGSWHQIVSLTRSLGDSFLPPWTSSYGLNLAVFSAPLIAMQVWQFRANDLLAPVRSRPWVRGSLNGVLLIAIVLFWQTDKVPFIYFQF